MTYSQEHESNCFNCPDLITNGNFENHIAGCPTGPFGIDVWSGISAGCMLDWNCSNGTADFFIQGGTSWYGFPSDYGSTVAHIGYGKYPNNAESFFQFVNILNDPDIAYCAALDVRKDCTVPNNTPGELEIRGHAGFLPCDPVAQFNTVGEVFHKLVVTGDALQSIGFYFKPNANMDKIIFSSNTLDIMQDPSGWCGLIVDNVELHCETFALVGIDVTCNGNGCYDFQPKFNATLNIVESFWTVDGVPIVTINGPSFSDCFDENETFEVCFNLTDDRRCCAQECITVGAQKGVCSYRHCMDCGETGTQYLQIVHTNIGDYYHPTDNNAYPVEDILGTNFIVDLEAWIESKNYVGTVSLEVITPTMADGCRGLWIYIEGSDIEFLGISYEQRDPDWGLGSINYCDFEEIGCID